MVRCWSILIRLAACIIACPQVDPGNLVFINNGLAINGRRLIKNSY